MEPTYESSTQSLSEESNNFVPGTVVSVLHISKNESVITSRERGHKLLTRIIRS